MKENTSVALSSDVLVAIDRLVGQRCSRAALIEGVLLQYLKDQARGDLQIRDLERISRASDRLNAEAAEVLAFQFSEN